VGLLEVLSVAFAVLCGAWSLLPTVRGSSTPADLAKLLLAALLFLAGPYLFSSFLAAFLDEPAPPIGGLLATLLLWWGLRHAPPALNIFRIWLEESPLLTHRLPWTQMAVSAALAGSWFLAAKRGVETKEY
jgi:hypothetical protein